MVLPVCRLYQIDLNQQNFHRDVTILDKINVVIMPKFYVAPKYSAELVLFSPAFLGKKKSGKIGESQEKTGTSWLFPTRLYNFKRSGWPIPIRPKIWNQSRRFGLPEPNNLDGRCTFKNPNLNFALRSVRQCQFISPLVAHHHNSNFRHVRLRPPADILVLTGLGCFGKKNYLMQWCADS